MFETNGALNSVAVTSRFHLKISRILKISFKSFEGLEGPRNFKMKEISRIPRGVLQI